MTKTALPYAAPSGPTAYSIELHSSAGGADKIYALSIEPTGDLWVVNYANGRRGSTLATGAKTKAPVAYEQAQKICNSTLTEKVGKGYLPIGGSHFGDGMAAEAIATAARKASGVLPQLANPIDPDDLDSFLFDNDYLAQQKFDGERRFVIVRDGEITGANRKGQTVALPKAIASSVAAAANELALDGEQVGDVFHAFDILSMNGVDLTGYDAFKRLSLLETLKDRFGAAIRVAPFAFTTKDKQDLLAQVTAANGEGVVFKRSNSTYSVGRPSSGGDWRKYKLWASLSAIVERVNEQRSVGLTLIDTDTGARVDVGNVTIPANRQVPQAGDVVEVRYLYAFEGGALFQPTYLDKRDDISADECTLDQRVLKPDEAVAGPSL